MNQFHRQKTAHNKLNEQLEYSLPSSALKSDHLTASDLSVLYRHGNVIANRFEVVKGPAEDRNLAGGMGIVYVCTDRLNQGSPVALKGFKSSVIKDLEKHAEQLRRTIERFLHEGNAWVSLGSHPNLVRCLEVVKAYVGTEVYLALELIPLAEQKHSASLRAWLRESKLSVEQALLFAIHITRGMKYATEKIPNLIHQDLKPENILIGKDGKARVTDFGMAGIVKAISKPDFKGIYNDPQIDQQLLMTITKDFAGTPEYASPEQFEAEKEPDSRSDQYALGCILYEMLTGRPPFTVFWKDQPERMIEYARCHLNTQLQRPRELNPSLNQIIEDIVLNCLQKDPAHRYANWIEVETALTKAYQEVTGKKVESEKVVMDERAQRVKDGWSLQQIGVYYKEIGKFDVALQYYDRALEIGRAEKERKLEGGALGSMGIVHAHKGKPRQAIQFFEQWLEITREVRDRHAEGQALHNLGSAYLDLHDVNRAIAFYEQDLAITHEIGDLYGVAQTLGNLGGAYRQKGDAYKAIEYHEQQLAIAKQIDDPREEGSAYAGLGTAYDQLGDMNKAIDCYQKNLDTSRRTANRQREMAALANLGSAYLGLGNPQQAIQYYEKSLSIAREIGDRHGEGVAIGDLGVVYKNLGDFHRAVQYYNQHLEITRALEDRRGEAAALGNLGEAYRRLRNPQLAIELQQQRLAIERELGNRYGEGQVLGNLGAAYADLGNIAQAMHCYKQRLEIAREIGDIRGAGFTSFNLALAMLKQGNAYGALQYAEYAALTFTQVGRIQDANNAQKLVAQIHARMR